MVVAHAAMPEPAPRASYRLRDVVLDVGAYTLRRDGRVIRLERQPMDLLILLVERRGQLVTRAEIVDVLWGKDVFVDVETGVHTAIRKIRQALRDAPEAPTFIETVPGKGYRFVAPVEAMRRRPRLPGVATSRRRSPPWRRRRILPAAAANDMAASRATSRVGAARSRRSPASSWRWRPGQSRRLARRPPRRGLPEPDEPLTIAVLPFELLGGDPANAYLADGLMEDTIASLGRIDPGRITVIGRTTMQAYRRTTKSIAEIGRELGADYLVEGSLRAEGERLRITSRLVRPTDQVQVWSRSFDRVVGSTFGVQQELSRSIADQRAHPALAGRQPGAGPPAFAQRGGLTTISCAAAPPSTSARPPPCGRPSPPSARDRSGSGVRAGLGESRSWPTRPGPSTAMPILASRSGWPEQAAQRAAALDPELAEAQHALGYVRWLLEWDWAGAETAFRRAIGLGSELSASRTRR